MNAHIACLAVLSFSFLLGSFSLLAQAPDSLTGKDWSKVHVYLHTIAPGNSVYDNFGHTALRVRDEKSGTDVVYNWGIYEFKEPLAFALKFYQSFLPYRLGILEFATALEDYKADGRSVWQDRLLLSDDEKRRLMNRLDWNALPENRKYLYDYLYDNCATRPRDYLDFALNGQIRRLTQGQTSSITHRDVVHSAYRAKPFLNFLLDAVLNSRVDSPLSLWDRMFLPQDLRELLFELNQDRTLIVYDQQLLEFKPPQPSKLNFYAIFGGLGGFGMLALAWMMRQRRIRGEGGVYFVLGWLCLYFGCIAGTFGFLYPLNTLFSEHLIIRNNALQWLYGPLDGVLLLLGIHFIFKRRPFAYGGRFLRLYFFAYCLGGLLLPGLWFFGLIKQDIHETLIYIFPVYWLFKLCIFLFGFASLRAVPPIKNLSRPSHPH